MRILLTALTALTLLACGPGAPSGESTQFGTTAKFLRSDRPVPNQYIIQFHDSVADVQGLASALAAQHGGETLFIYQSALRGFAARMTEAQAIALSHNPLVKLVEEDGVAEAVATQTNPPWGLDRIDQRTLPLNSTYVYNYTGAGVNAYIIDTGIRRTHVDFGGRAVIGYDAIGDGQNSNDCNGHGTHVAGTVGGTIYGVAKGVKLYAVRVLNCQGSGTWSQVIAGVNWVASNHVKPAVANMSLGSGANSSVDTAVNNAVSAGVTFAVAAGNSNANACNYSPARVASAITVGATDKTDTRASFSNYGSCLDIFAPGVSIPSDYYTSDTATATLSGTSMASPHVAGAAALYLQTNPISSPAAVTSALLNKATNGVVINPGIGSPNRLLYSL